jgi:hypothetical protein
VIVPGSTRLGRWGRRAAVIGLFLLLTAVMTWPQPLVLATHAVDHQDVYFNLWRLGWISHALATAPADLFNGNQFHPELRVLAYSDAMLVEGLVATPLLWSGLPRVLVHNLMLLGAIAASGIGMFTLARHMSGSTTGAIVAGIVFAFVPYRFDHYMHMELQWTMWMPWAFWAMQRTLETGSLRFGALTGLFVALQMLSSVYYGIFLALIIAVVGAAELLTLHRARLLPAVRALALGALVAGSISAVYSIPYSKAAARVGVRGMHEVTMFSARPRDYRRATPTNLLYGNERGRPERRLFPGVVPSLLALVGLLLVRPRPSSIAYVLGLIVAFELSLGMYGRLYPFLLDHVSAFAGLRAPARAAIIAFMFLGVLAAQGYAALTSAMPSRARQLLAPIVVGVVLLEYWVAPLNLVAYPNTPPPLYAFLARQPKGVVAEFPFPHKHAMPGQDARYAFMSTFHWMPIVNGYSGYYPPSYLNRIDRLENFPDARTLEALKAEGVRYVVIHTEDGVSPQADPTVGALVIRYGVQLLGTFDSGKGDAALFALQ